MATVMPDPAALTTESQLAALASRLLENRPGKTPVGLVELRDSMAIGDDPLGEAFCRLRSGETRRRQGAVYTPRAIVDAMVNWADQHAAESAPPVRIVDPGAGSGRFLLAAARKFPKASLVAIEIDPLAVLLLRANARLLGVENRLTVLEQDFRSVDLPLVKGATLFLGNPPYVRHHDISSNGRLGSPRTRPA